MYASPHRESTLLDVLSAQHGSLAERRLLPYWDVR